MNHRSTSPISAVPYLRMLAIALTLFFSASSFAQEPPLVPRKVFDAPAEHDFLTVSPNGKTIAYTAPSDQGVANVWVEDLSTHKKRMVTRAGHRGIGEYEWAYDNEHLLYQSDENGNEDFHLYSVDLTSGAIRDLTPFLGVRAEQTLLAPSRPDEVLVSMNLRDSKVFDVYRVNLQTGATVLDAQNPGDVIGWTVMPIWSSAQPRPSTTTWRQWSASTTAAKRNGAIC